MYRCCVVSAIALHELEGEPYVAPRLRAHGVRESRNLDILMLVKILIVTAFYPPENAIAAQRPLSWAREWSLHGHEITVLTVRREASDAIGAAASLVGVRIIDVPPAGIFSWLRQIYRRGRADQSIVENQGESAVVKSSSKLSWLKSKGLLSSVRWPDVYDFWTAPALRAARGESFDCVVSTFGPPAVLAVGWELKQRGQTKKWVIDFRDLWTDNPSFRGFPVIRWFERLAESFYLKKADAVTTVSEPLAKTLRLRRNDVTVFTNGFEGEALAEPVFVARPTKVIRYTGSLYWPYQDPTPLFAVLSERRKAGLQDLFVEFYGPGLEKISQLASEVGVEDLVKVFSRTTREQSLALQRSADALLFLESPRTPGREGVLTGKLFEYLAARRPILAVGIHNESLAGEIIRECDAGFSVEKNEESIRQFLDALSSGTLAVRPQGLPERFNRKVIAKKMLEMLSSI